MVFPGATRTARYLLLYLTKLKDTATTRVCSVLNPVTYSYIQSRIVRTSILTDNLYSVHTYDVLVVHIAAVGTAGKC